MHRVLIFGFAVLLGSGCVAVSTGGGEVDVDVRRPGETGEEWNATLAGQPGYAGISATARALSEPGQTRVTVNLSGAPAGGVHPWHIHEGKCGSGGGVVGDPAAYPPLRPASGGTVVQSATIGVPLNETSEYHVNVHLSPQAMQTIIACGDLDD